MIPLKLQIKNFLSYGPEIQEIDFTRYQMICLSGKNGHGKSALLDAITWAVWGQARKTSGQPKPDHGLLHLGERNMKVIFDFEFNNKRYRVRREFTFAYGKPTAYLEFGMFINDTDELITLTDKTIRKTQAKVDLLLGLDFDSFVNSAFIRQGNAGEFSNKSPKERKDILGNILGLGIYDKLRKSASDKSRGLENERQALLKLQERLLLELDESKGVQAKVQELEIRLQQIQEQQANYEAKINSYQNQRQQLLLRQQVLLENDKKLQALNQIYQQDVVKLFNLRASWQQINNKNHGSLNQQELELQQIDFNQQLVDLRLKQKNNWQIREQLSQANVAYNKIENSILNEHDQKINQSNLDLEKLQLNFAHQDQAYQKTLTEYDLLVQEQAQINSQLSNYHALNMQVDILQKQFERYKEFYQRLIVIGNNAKREQDESVRKQRFLEQNCPACPLCEQDLPNLRKQMLAEQFRQDCNFNQHRVTRIAKILKELKIVICDQHEILEKQKTELHKLNLLQSQTQQINIKSMEFKVNLPIVKQKIEQLGDVINYQQVKLKNLVQARANLLQNHAQAISLSLQIKNYEQELQTNSYQEIDLQNLEQKLEKIKILLTVESVDVIAQQKAQILAQVSVLVDDLKQKKILIKDLTNNILENKDLNDHIVNLDQNLLNLNQELSLCKIDRELILQEQGSIFERLKKINQTRLELDHLKKDLISLQDQVQDYKLLTSAFGKDGLQALLIEDAIPEIEQEANYLLGRLTDNQSQLFIESLRDLKSGGTKETLDIKISDSVGLRPYEMFSGGEAFRIDFALRIAISKLLARRAGTALQTLIIDEGFGSQDEEGLAHIMEALYKIQDDFAKIIIVSHLNTMKEQFPVHFVINKTSIGSTVSVFEQG